MTEVAKIKENMMKCLCKSCPSYTFGCKMKAIPGIIGAMLGADISKKDHLESLFCAYEPSYCIKKKKGCVCLNCPVAKENALTQQYYCLKKDGE